MKAVIEIAPRNTVFAAAERQLQAARRGRAPDYRLSFESPRALFAALTAARLELLDTLRRIGPCSVYALAKSSGRNYSNVHGDIGALDTLGLVERSDDGCVSVPFSAVEIRLPLARVA
jgi:predicted transcriptional regulator